MKRDLPEVVPVPDHDPSLPAAASVVIDVLGPMVTEARKARIEAVLAARTRSVVPVLEHLSDPHNGAAVLRTCDAFGVQEIHVVESRERFVSSSRVAKSAERWLDVRRFDDVRGCVAELRSRGFTTLVAAMDGERVPEELAAIPKLAVVFGNEHAGVSADVRAVVDGAYRVPMHGFVDSLNVSVAAAITLQAAMRGRRGDLTPDDAERLRARFYVRSVDQAEAIVAEHLRRMG